jgi:hypothetical protein
MIMHLIPEYSLFFKKLYFSNTHTLSLLPLTESSLVFPASNGYLAEPVGCRIPFGSYVLCQVQGVDSCVGYTFKTV